MSFNAQILADSLSSQGDRITTMKITFPRMVLAEFNTHRMFSRNSASSRAIPFKKMVQMVEENPFIPIAWQKDHKGMQGTEYFTDADDLYNILHEYKCGVEDAVLVAKSLNELGVTKQLCNRLLEPFMWHTVIVTATEWENFFKLRCPQYIDAQGEIFKSKKDYIKKWKHECTEKGLVQAYPNNNLQWLSINQSQAEIHIQAIAELMWDAMNESTPKHLEAGEWHIPFGDTLVNHVEEDGLHTDSKIDLAGGWIGLFPDIDNIEDIPYDYQYDNWLQQQKLKISTARCARISYKTLGDDPKIDYEADIRLHDMLLESGHMSPFEHCARAMSDEEFEYYKSFSNAKFNEDGTLIEDSVKGWCRNFRGFIQYRHLVEL